jgi:L-lysine exporter family protein LysE/ArgO
LRTRPLRLRWRTVKRMELFAAGFLLSLSLCFDLGVVNTAMVRAGLNHGPKPVLMIGFGSSIGDLFYALISGVTVSFLLKYVVVRWAFWLGGTLALLWLAWGALSHAYLHLKGDAAALEGTPRLSSRVYFFNGLMLALASPSALLWFATVGGSVIASQNGQGMALLPFFVGFLTCGVVWSIVMAWVVGQARQVFGTKLTRWLSMGSALLFAYFAVSIFVAGYREWIGR